MSRFLVTGATGFLGRHLVRALLDARREVVALCRDPVAAAARLTGLDVEVREGDVLDAQSVESAAQDCTGAFHCAGRVSRDPADAEEMYSVHVLGTKATLEGLRRAGVGRVVVASTSGVVGVGTDPTRIARETDAEPLSITARWPYYRAKLFADRWARAQSQTGIFEVVLVNPSLLLGPGDDLGSSTGDVRRFLERRVQAVPAGGLSFVDVRDAAAALLLAMEKGRPGERYMLGAANLTFAAFLGRLARIADMPGPALRLPPLGAAGVVGVRLLERLADRVGAVSPIDAASFDMAQHYWYVDSSRAERELGWSARDPIETLRDTVDDLRTRGVVWPQP